MGILEKFSDQDRFGRLTPRNANLYGTLFNHYDALLMLFAVEEDLLGLIISHHKLFLCVKKKKRKKFDTARVS